MKKFLVAIAISLAAIGAAHAESFPARVIADPGIVCNDEAAIKVLRHLKGNGGDEADFIWLVEELAKSGACGVLPKGTNVVVEKFDNDNGAICMRPVDMPPGLCAWTAVETVK